MPPVLIAISLEKFKPFPAYPWSFETTVRATSNEKGYGFTFVTNPLPDPSPILQAFRRLSQHGSTVIEFSDEKHCFHTEPTTWQDGMVRTALDKVERLYAGREPSEETPAYDPGFAETVLKETQKAFPRELSTIELKYRLQPEPSDKVLLTAINALYLQKYIEGPASRMSIYSYNRLEDVGSIRITSEGLEHLKSLSHPNPPSESHVVHNFGNIGAIGTNAQGVVNVYDRWTAIERQVDVRVLAIQLETLRVELRRSATTREDDRQVALIAEAAEAAEQGNGKGAAGLLSRASKSVLKAAQDIGTDVAAKVIVEMAKGG